MRTDIGNGIKPLRAVVDLDTRGTGAPADAKRLMVDTLIKPLPAQIHTLYEPGTATAPTHILYESSSTTDISANALIAESTGQVCGELQVTCATTNLYKLPSRLELKLPSHDGTDFSVAHNAVAPNAPDLTAIVDKTTDDLTKRVWASVALLRIPNTVTGRLDSQAGVVKAAEFHDCTWNFDTRTCAETNPVAIGRVRFTVRNGPGRGSLPPPPDTVATFVTMLKRDADLEISGQVDEVRNVVFHQRVGADGKATGTIGALVDVGSNAPFDVVVDQVKESKSTVVNAKVRNLPSSFSVCFRDTAEVAPPDPTTLAVDPLLTECDRTDRVTTDAGEHVTTPMSVHYTASTPTDVTADVLSNAPNPDDGGLFKTTKLHTHVGALPATLHADVISPITPVTGINPVAGRKLKVLYQAASPVDLEFALETRRQTSLCSDPRPHQQATCFSANLHSLPSTITATYDPDPSKGDIEMITSPPAMSQPALSLDPIKLTQVSDDPASTPLTVTGKILGITPHVKGKLVQADTDGTGKNSLAKVSFNACPDADCAGIGRIDVTATNTPIAGLFQPPVPPLPDADVTASGGNFFSFVQVGKAPNSLFQAHATIGNLKEISYSKLSSDGPPAVVSKATMVRAAFADPLNTHPKLQAYVNRDLGTETQVISAVISKAPSVVDLCFRSRIAPDAPATSGNFCETAANDKMAIQGRVTPIDPSTLPDIDVRQLQITKGGSASSLNGSFFIQDLGARADVLVGKDNADKLTDILVEGHNADGTLGNVVGRATFDIKNYAGTGVQTGFPYKSVNNTDVEPGADTRNADPAGKPDQGTNYIEMLQNVNALHAFGSVPAIQRIFMAKDRCIGADARFPDASTFPAPLRPEYTCINAQVGQGRPLGFAIRTLDVSGGALSVDEGHIDSVPAGSGGITAALTSVPDTLKLSPSCSLPNAPEFTPPLYCRPPLLSVNAPKATGQTSNLEARLGIGPTAVLSKLVGQSVLDAGTSSRLDLEQHPRDFTVQGARVKIGTQAKSGGGTDVGLRVGINLALPNFLDIDQPTAYSCRRDSAMNGCNADPKLYNGDTTFKGFNAGDTFFKLVAANSGHDGSDVDYLGRVAMLYNNFDDGGQIYLSGIPDGDNQTGGTPYNQENAPPVCGSAYLSNPACNGVPYDLGAQLPGHLDLHVYTRDPTSRRLMARSSSTSRSTAASTSR